MNWYKQAQYNSPLYRFIVKIKPKLAAAAQEVYDSWDASNEVDGDFEVGFGGICHLIAEAIADVVYKESRYQATTMNASCGENHVWAIIYSKKEGFHVDIPYHIYETGSGYSWKKIEGVKFDPSDITIYAADIDDVKAMIEEQ